MQESAKYNPHRKPLNAEYREEYENPENNTEIIENRSERKEKKPAARLYHRRNNIRNAEKYRGKHHDSREKNHGLLRLLVKTGRNQTHKVGRCRDYHNADRDSSERKKENE